MAPHACLCLCLCLCLCGRTKAFVLANQAALQIVAADPDPKHVFAVDESNDAYTLSNGLTAITPVITMDGKMMRVFCTWVAKSTPRPTQVGRALWQPFMFHHYKCGRFDLTNKTQAHKALRVCG